MHFLSLMKITVHNSPSTTKWDTTFVDIIEASTRDELLAELQDWDDDFSVDEMVRILRVTQLD